MTAGQRNKMAMFNATKNVFGTYPEELGTINALANFIEDFKQLMLKIEEVHKVQEGNTTGNRQLKLKEEEEMITATVQIAGTMYVYAQVNNLPDLMEKCSVSVTQLRRQPDEQLKAACTNIYDEAVKLGDALSDYGKTPEQVAQLKKEIDDFAALIASPRSAIVTRSQATKELAVLIDEANDMLCNKIDKLINLLKDSQPKVYNTYKGARVIVDLRAGKKLIEAE